MSRLFVPTRNLSAGSWCGRGESLRFGGTPEDNVDIKQKLQSCNTSQFFSSKAGEIISPVFFKDSIPRDENKVAIDSKIKREQVSSLTPGRDFSILPPQKRELFSTGNGPTRERRDT